MNLYLDNETNIIEDFQERQNTNYYGEIIFLGESQLAKKVYAKISEIKYWCNWINSSGKSDPPPDFYSEKYKLMMDVMRVNDNEQKFINGKKEVFVNREIEAERKASNELEQFLKENNITANKVFINSNSGLIGDDAHNYQRYKEHFRRVVQEHIDSIPLYKTNHPGYKVIFFINDESDCYRIEPGMTSDDFHLFYKDKNFVEMFVESGIDIVIWHTPEKRVLTPEFGWVQCFNTVIIDTRFLNTNDFIEYDENKIKWCNK